MNRLPHVITDALDDYAIAAAKCAEAREHEQRIEDERPMIKHAAIVRLMQGTNALTGKPHSASSAEAIVESDPDYAGYLATRRDAVHQHMLAQAERDVARMRALAYSNMSAELAHAA